MSHDRKCGRFTSENRLIRGLSENNGHFRNKQAVSGASTNPNNIGHRQGRMTIAVIAPSDDCAISFQSQAEKPSRDSDRVC
jgi:hypothetical protein